MVKEKDSDRQWQVLRITYEEAEEKLIRVQKLDKLKDEFCASRNFPLLRIPYWHKDKARQMVTNFIKQHHPDCPARSTILDFFFPLAN
jgi:hypothetical protein